MKKDLKKFSSFAIGALCMTMGVVALTGCNKSPATSDSTEDTSTGKSSYSGTLKVAGPSLQLSWIAARLAEFNAQRVEEGYPSITFETLALEESEADSAVSDWSAGPDVYQFASDKIQNLYGQGALAQIRGSYRTFLNETVDPEAVSIGYFANKQLGYPFDGGNGYFLYYDKTVDGIEKAIGSMESLLALATTTNKTIGYDLRTAYYSAGAFFTFGARYNLTINAQGETESIEADFDSEKGLKAGKAIYNIVKHDKFVSSTTKGPGGNVLATVSGPWSYSDYSTDVGGVDNLGCAKLPTVTVDGDTKNLGSFLGYKVLGVNPQASSGNDDRLAAAHEVAMYLCSEEVQEKRFDDFSTVPTNINVKQLQKVKDSKVVSAIFDQSEFAVAQTAVPPQIWTAPQTFVAGIINGTITLDNMQEALITMNEAIEASSNS
ncbi:MAG: extracellular solute-binding protein [Bacilli bacterium]